MLYREAVAVCFQIHTTCVNMVWEECRIFIVLKRKPDGKQVSFEGEQHNFASLNICVCRQIILGNPRELVQIL